MTFVSIDAWEGSSDETAQQLMAEITESVQRILKAPPNNIIVVFRANPVKYWTQGAIPASDPDFIEKSRFDPEPS